jgi:[protein-PII] uridylyltransferase
LLNPHQALEQLWQQGFRGYELLVQHSLFVDSFVTKGFFASGASGKIAVLALGGYGRQELYPFSDLDLLLLHEQKDEEMQEVAEALLYPLWDAGFRVGHSVRRIDETLAFAQEDYFFQVALLDARFLAGSQELYLQLVERYRTQVLEGQRKQFVCTMELLRTERRQKYGTHAYLLEPHIKDGKGGMRDIQAMLWAAKAVFGLTGLNALEDSGLFTSEERQDFARSWDMLMQIRYQLHLLSRRANDRLFFEYQEEMAAAFGFQDGAGVRAVEQFMRQVYGHLQCIALTTDVFFEQVHENLGLLGRDSREQELEKGLILRAGMLRLSLPEAELALAPHLFMRLFFHAGRTGLPIHYRSRQILGRHLQRADEGFRQSKRVVKTFFSLLMSEHAVHALELMLETGFLSAYLPEFSQVESLAQHDLYHIYTVDRHQVQTVAMLQALQAQEAALFSQLPAPHLLYCAALLHDIGKGRQQDHSQLGAELIRGIAQRMGCTEQEEDSLAFLVRHHLLLPECALRRDLSDHEFIVETARRLGSTERLIMLYLLSIADSQATGPSAWSSWKAGLMREFFEKVRAVLEEIPPSRGLERVQEVKALLQDNERFDIQPEALPADYLHSFPPELVLRHLRLHRDWSLLRQQKILLFPEKQARSWSVLILCQDRQGLLAKLCGVLALHRLAVLAAQIFTWPDGTVVDVLDLSPEVERDFEEQDWQSIEHDLNRAVNYRLDVSLQLYSKLDQLTQNRRVQQVHPEVLINNSTSRQYTVIEVHGTERPGALYQLTQTLSDFRLHIHRAKVATEVEQLIHIFYVSTEQGKKIEHKDLLRAIHHALLHILRGDQDDAMQSKPPALPDFLFTRNQGDTSNDPQ